MADETMTDEQILKDVEHKSFAATSDRTAASLSASGVAAEDVARAAAQAAYDEARLGYEQKVLTVFKEANDAVVSYRSVRRTAALKVNLRDAARKYVELAQLQYINGVISYMDVLDAQRGLLDAQIGLNNAVLDELLSVVYLYKALGGGF